MTNISPIQTVCFEEYSEELWKNIWKTYHPNDAENDTEGSAIFWKKKVVELELLKWLWDLKPFKQTMIETSKLAFWRNSSWAIVE